MSVVMKVMSLLHRQPQKHVKKKLECVLESVPKRTKGKNLLCTGLSDNWKSVMGMLSKKFPIPLKSNLDVGLSNEPNPFF